MPSDDGFRLPSPHAADALTAATSLLQWSKCPANQAACSVFSRRLLQSLRQCLPANSSQAGREKMWSKFHQLRTAKTFQTLWEDFLKVSTKCPPHPILYQYLTIHIFKDLIREHFPTVTPSATIQQESLTYEEKNAVRYAAGYIPRALRSKLERSSHPLKEELILCMLDLTDEDGVADESQDWLQEIDRGGLKHVNSNMYLLMAAMELELQVLLRQAGTQQIKLKEKAIASIQANKDVLLRWSILSADWEAEEEQALFPMIVDLWVTMRGFAFASAWVEKHKERSKITSQKSKGIRKHLLS